MTTQTIDFSEIDLTGGLRWNGEVIGAAHYNGERLWPFGVDLLYTGGVGGASYLPDPADVYGASGLAAFGDGVSAVLDEKNGTPVFGPELVSNGGFDTDTGWTKGIGWTIAGGVATKAAGTAAGLDQAESFVAGSAYEVSFALTRTAGTLTPQFIGGTTVSGAALSATGTYRMVLRAVTGNVTLRLNGDASFAGSVDNFSVREVPGRHALQPSASLRPLLGRAPKSRRNLLVNTDALATQSRAVTNVAHTLSFKGTGSVARSGASTGTLAGTGANNRVSVTFTPTAGTLTFTISGSVTEAQLEVGSAVTPYQSVGAAVDMTEAGVPSYPFIRLDLSDDALVTTLPQAVTGDVVIAGRNGSWIEARSFAAGGTFSLGPTGTIPTPGILRAIGDVVGWSILNKTLTAAERERLMRFYKRRGAKGLLVPGPELVVNGGFDTDLSGWSSVGWFWENGAARHLFTQTPMTILQGNATPGRAYLVSYDVVNFLVGGSMQVTVGGALGSQAIRSNGSYSDVVVATGTQGWGINAQGTWQSSIDNISVRELRPEEEW